MPVVVIEAGPEWMDSAGRLARLAGRLGYRVRVERAPRGFRVSSPAGVYYDPDKASVALARLAALRDTVLITINGQRYKSYDILFMLLRRAIADGMIKRPRVLDITYGKGRWWRRAKPIVEYLVGVDIYKHEHEVAPNMFYNHDARDTAFLGGLVQRHDINVVAVDPPWNAEKRGQMPRRIGISDMPYHMNVNSRLIIESAKRLARLYGLLLIYRYHTPLPGSRLVFAVRIKLFRNEGTVYYGVWGDRGG